VEALEMVAVGVAGVAAGGLNAVVGSGTLITFPTLLAFGFPPVLANVSNNLGLVPGTLSAAYGYRREMKGQAKRLVRFGTASLIGGLMGALLLLKLPADAFQAVVPVLILSACALVLLQPWLNRRLKERGARGKRDGGVPMWCGVLATGVYGGYFGAAQGVLLMGLFGAFLLDDLQRLNAVKNVLASIVNGIAAVVFIAVADIDWAAAGLIAAGSTVGGLVGARYGRRLPPVAMRGFIVVVGVTASAVMIARARWFIIEHDVAPTAIPPSGRGHFSFTSPPSVGFHAFVGEYAERTASHPPGRHHASMDGAQPVQVLFTPEEYASVLLHADRLGMPVAEFIRRAVTVRAEERLDPCRIPEARRGASVPPVQRSLGTDGKPALRRFLDTLATSGEPKE
jgi:uncharacterized membrane protein YfcA